MDLFSLAGKVAIVTGSTRGIGRAIVEQMALAGAKVVVSSRKADACEKTRSELQAAGHEAIAVPCNVGYKEQCEQLVRTTLDTWGGVDVLVLNAAINPYFGSMQEMSDDVFDKMIGTNLKAQLWLCKLVCPQMADRGKGAIVIISSIAALRGNSKQGMYGLCKAADIQLARNLALEWGAKGIRANAISPGLVKTDFAKVLYEDPARLKRRLEAIALGRLGEPNDIAGLAVCLASDAGLFITGQNLVADGGETIRENL
jgi:NAD(P)-dependent dehydrogenase (short-subunit alcohol dehydrogenase family)